MAELGFTCLISSLVELVDIAELGFNCLISSWVELV